VVNNFAALGDYLTDDVDFSSFARESSKICGHLAETLRFPSLGLFWSEWSDKIYDVSSIQWLHSTMQELTMP